ncbi:MAG TPA: RsiV family protein [Desulfitobacteriaceae bacterium]|nr:RsiV family protein [Desulfitobacteriaceae bacterium]
MKRFVYLLVALLLIVTINACGKNKQTNEQGPISTSQALSLKTNQASATSQIPSTTEAASSLNSQDKIINSFTLAIENRALKKRIVNDYQVTIDYDLNFVQLTGTYKGIEAINNYYDLKEKTYFFGKEYNDYFNYPNSLKDNNFYLKADYRVEVQAGDILSISGSGDSWAGGVSNPTLYGDVFDLNTGDKLTLADIFKVSPDEYLNLIYGEAAKSINKEIAEGNNRYSFDDAYSEDGQAVIKQEFKHEKFYLTEKSLVVFYPKYSLGAGAAGTFKFEIPLDLIKDKSNIDISKIKLFALLINKDAG